MRALYSVFCNMSIYFFVVIMFIKVMEKYGLFP